MLMVEVECGVWSVEGEEGSVGGGPRVGLIGCGVVSSLDCGWRRSQASGLDILSHTHTHTLRITWRWRA